jgi:hypothetical protein
MPAAWLYRTDIPGFMRKNYAECDMGLASPGFARPNSTPYNKKGTPPSRKTMPLSGEAIRLMNYIDDVAVTLRRVLATIPTLTPEERAKVAEHLQQAHPSAEDVAEALAVK